jgi:hypothetical protein
MGPDHTIAGFHISEWAAIVNAATVVILGFGQHLLSEDCQGPNQGRKHSGSGEPKAS